MAYANQGGGEDNIGVGVARRTAESKLPVVPEQNQGKIVSNDSLPIDSIVRVPRSSGVIEDGWRIKGYTNAGYAIVVSSNGTARKEIPPQMLQDFNPQTILQAKDVDGVFFVLRNLGGIQSSLGQDGPFLISCAQRFLRGELPAEQLEL